MLVENLEELPDEDRKILKYACLCEDEREHIARTDVLKEKLEEEVRVHGVEKVLEQVFKEYQAWGREEGETAMVQMITRDMLRKGLEISLISEMTGLSVAEIEQLNHKTAD